MKVVNLYTDGACSGNPGRGGYAGILIYKNTEKEYSGYEENTTNNRMELTAVIEGLKLLKEKCKVNVYSDSAYVINAFSEKWIIDWQLNNWKNKQKKEVSNKDLWLLLLDLTNKHQINWNKVKGHSDNVYNNRCDKMAVCEINKNSIL